MFDLSGRNCSVIDVEFDLREDFSVFISLVERCFYHSDSFKLKAGFEFGNVIRVEII